MASTADTAFANTYAQDRTLFGVSVQVQRGATTDAAVTAVVEKEEDATTTFGMDDDEDEGTSIKVEEKWYVFDLANYTSNTVATKPQEGDRIRETVNGTEYQYEVVHFQWYDEDGLRWLVKTNKVGAV